MLKKFKFLMKIKNFYFKYFSFKDTSNRKNLTNISIVLLAILDIIIFINISYGLNFQTKVMNNPDIMYPNSCKVKEFTNIEQLSNFNMKSTSESKVFRFKTNLNDKNFQYIQKDLLSDECKVIKDKVFSLQEKYSEKIIYMQKLKQNKRYLDSKLNIEINKYRINNKKRNYKTKISVVSVSRLEKSKKIKEISSNFNTKIEEISVKIKQLKQEFLKDNELKQLNAHLKVQNLSEKYATFKESYDTKKRIVEILFVLPLFITFFILMNISNGRSFYTKYIIYKNMVFVSAIPLALSFTTFIKMIFPYELVNNLILYFYSLKIPFVVYYILVRLCLFIFMFIIIKIQNNASTKEEKELEQKRIIEDNKLKEKELKEDNKVILSKDNKNIVENKKDK